MHDLFLIFCFMLTFEVGSGYERLRNKRANAPKEYTHHWTCSICAADKKKFEVSAADKKSIEFMRLHHIRGWHTDPKEK